MYAVLHRLLIYVQRVTAKGNDRGTLIAGLFW